MACSMAATAAASLGSAALPKESTSSLPGSIGLRQLPLQGLTSTKGFQLQRHHHGPAKGPNPGSNAARPLRAVAQVATTSTTRAIQRAQQVGVEGTILLQGFHWEASKQSGGWWNYVNRMIPEFKNAGFTHIWLPPPSMSVAAEGYMPTQWYNMNSKYGSNDEIRKLVGALMDANIVPVADIVINHRSGTGVDPSGVVYDQFTDDVGGPVRWGRREVTSNDDYVGRIGGGFGNQDTGEDFGGAPDLDHTSPVVQAGVISWLNWLINEIGFGGFRFDMIKGYKASFLEQYVRATSGPGVFNVGEFYDYDRQAIVDYVDKAKGVSTAFDFPTKKKLQDAIGGGFTPNYGALKDGEGKPSGMLGYWSQKAVTFLENHDTEKVRNNGQNFPDNHVTTGYAYILTHPCIPTVFWTHYFDWGLGAVINQLLAVRIRNGITANSKVTIQTAENDLYVAKVDDKVVVKLGPRWGVGPFLPNPAEGWRLAASGTDYAVWDKTAPLRQPNIPGSNMLPLM